MVPCQVKLFPTRREAIQNDDVPMCQCGKVTFRRGERRTVNSKGQVSPHKHGNLSTGMQMRSARNSGCTAVRISITSMEQDNRPIYASLDAPHSVGTPFNRKGYIPAAISMTCYFLKRDCATSNYRFIWTWTRRPFRSNESCYI